MSRTSTSVRILAIAAALLLFALAGGTAFAVADDFAAREVLPAGASVAGETIGGLTRAEALDAVREKIAKPLSQPLTVTYGDRTFDLDAASLITVDVEGMVAAAFEPKANSSLTSRVSARLRDRETGAAIAPEIAIDTAALDAWIAGVASQIDTAPADAVMVVRGTTLKTIAARTGQVVDRKTAAQTIANALTSGAKQVSLPVTVTEPKVAAGDLGPTILVRRSQRRLYLYDHGNLVKTYSVAVGTPGYPTPRGDFTIVLKRYRPTWSNPGSDWAKDMPAYIPPGPGNPLGTRALNLDAPGIRIHGTSNNSSIGTAASHGCMRMHMWDIEDLYDRVPVGTPVHVIN
ncbi:MAG: L,D-transpeptidase/peptidoglycan binding protein [Actinomycetia bacterium]|nr:L,D-transpeptidase/peptidoglycan binding protein [Actinomycetes bacterium]